jgi:glycosyltransferase involved in cell wall biosynthesis
VEGLPVRNGDHVVLADRPDDFAAAVVRLLKDTTARDALGSRARAYVEAHASWRHAGAVLAEACRSVARG